MSLPPVNPSARASSSPEWKRYPFVIPGADPAWFTFPAAEGDQGCQANTYFLESRLTGVTTGRELAVMVIFSASTVPLPVAGEMRADFYVVSYFDLTTGEYGTTTEFDFPKPPRIRRTRKLRVARGVLDVSFETPQGRARWAVRRDAAGAPAPFSYALELRGRDHHGREMAATLDVEVGKPPAPVGGDELHGVKSCCAQIGTFSYVQAGLSVGGRFRWGDFSDDVRGDVGWIDRQFARRHFGAYTDRRNSRHRHEWRVIHLDNGWDISVWQQFDAKRGDRLVPYSGVTAVGPNGEVRATSDFHVERLTFVRDSREIVPDRPLSRGPTYLTDRFHLTVRDWGLALTAQPLTPAPAHRMPIEYWNGPVRLIGQMAGRPVEGFGFHERSKVWWTPFDLVYVLRETLRHLPAVGHGGASPQALANRVWECDLLLARNDKAGAQKLLDEQVAPGIATLGAPGREMVRQAYEALRSVLA
jgi:hypothetical protein